MDVYFSVDPEATSDLQEAREFLKFLQAQGHTVYRAPYVLSDSPSTFLREQFGLTKEQSCTEQREMHLRWIDDSDLLVADISAPSEGMWVIIQRALDKAAMGLNKTPVILIKNKNKQRRFGKIVRGLIESDKVAYCEYASINEVARKWPELLEKALQAK